MSILSAYQPEDGAGMRRRRPTSVRQQLRNLRSAAMSHEPDPIKFQRLMDFEKLVISREAKAVFDADFAVLQAELPSITEHGTVISNQGRLDSTYARWEDINRVIMPILTLRGFSLRFKTGQEGTRIVVTAYLHHVAGHTEETTMWLPVGMSGNKNSVQAIGSSTSYGKRYTACALLNITSTGEDDDGNAAGRSPTINDERAGELRRLLASTGASESKFLALVGAVSLDDVPVAKFRHAVLALKAKEARK